MKKVERRNPDEMELVIQARKVSLESAKKSSSSYNTTSAPKELATIPPHPFWLDLPTPKHDMHSRSVKKIKY
jgi:hypothetical protein